MISELIAALEKTLGISQVNSDSNHSHYLTIGDSDVFLHDDEDQILIVIPVGYLPINPSRALTDALLHSNMFDSDWAPFQLATDEHSMILQWGKLRIADLSGEKLAGILSALIERIIELRAELSRCESPSL